MRVSGLIIVFLSLLCIQFCESQSPPPNQQQDTNLLWSTINGASSIAVDGEGNVFISSPKENIIYQLNNLNGTAEIYAGTGNSGLVDGDSFTTAQFNSPQGIAFDKTINAMYVCDTGNNAIRKIYQGVVSTLKVTVDSPVSITIVTAPHYSYELSQSPTGLYVVSTDGTVSLIQDGPINDNCKDATYLGTPTATAPLAVYGSLDKASIDTGFFPCENTQGILTVNYPEYSIWYTFTGTGNLMNVSTCNSQTTSFTNLFVYRASDPTSTDASCESLQCMGWVNSQSHTTCYGSLFSFCSQQGVTYYVAVSIPYYYSELNVGQVELAIFDIGPVGCSQCTCDNAECQTNECRGYCPDAPTCSGDSSCISGACFNNAVNDQCDGAIEIVGNSTLIGNTLRDIAPLTPIIADGNCLQRRNHGLWYKTVGTGFLTSLSTCSPDTQIQVMIHLYQSLDTSSCTEELLCVDMGQSLGGSNCGNFYNTEVFYCAEKGATYYYFVESTSNLGQFALVQQTTEEVCIPGNDYNPPYGYSSFYFTSFTSFTSYFTSFTSWYYYDEPL